MFFHPRRLFADKHDWTDDYIYTSEFMDIPIVQATELVKSEFKTNALLKQMEDQTLLIPDI